MAHGWYAGHGVDRLSADPAPLEADHLPDGLLSRWAAAQAADGGWIRRMFQEGEALRAQHGADAVVDLSLGQPLEAPEPVRDALRAAASQWFPGRHAYMPNLGFPELRERAVHDVACDGVTSACIAITGGAAAAICLALRAFVDGGDEVLGVTPHFPEFGPYCETGGARFVPIRADDRTQSIDIDALVAALTSRTTAMLLNTPCNPTGHVIEHDEMAAVVEVIEHHNRRTGRRMLLLVDEAYRNLVYPPARRVEPFDLYDHTVVARSFSKDLGLAGERIGYLALHPSLAGERTSRALASCMRALGMVNAPATAQQTLMHLESWHVDVSPYRRRRDHALAGAQALGFEVAEPQGGIFLWIRSPWPDGLAYVAALAAEHVLVTPGIAFNAPDRLRLCFTTSEDRLARGIAIAGEVAARGAGGGA